jgi:hypothetical protein
MAALARSLGLTSELLADRLGLTRLNCSSFRVPVARLAAAQAAVEEKRKAKAARKK